VEVWQTSNLRRLRLGEEKRKRRRRTNHTMKIYMVSLFHRATINKVLGVISKGTWPNKQFATNVWTLWCKRRSTEADTPTFQLGATQSGLTSAHLHHPPIFYRPDALPAAQPTVSKH